MQRDTAEKLIALLPQLRRFAMSLTRSGADADDLVQATVERAINRIDSWEHGTRLDSWLYRIAQNTYLNELRRAKVRRLHGDAVMAEPTPVSEGGAEAHLELNQVKECIDKLPSDQRQALLLVAVEGYGYAEAADIVGVPIGTITSRLARARGAIGTMRNERKRA